MSDSQVPGARSQAERRDASRFTRPRRATVPNELNKNKKTDAARRERRSATPRFDGERKTAAPFHFRRAARKSRPLSDGGKRGENPGPDRK